jgi:conjugal transfer pilus assembly protein TraK
MQLNEFTVHRRLRGQVSASASVSASAWILSLLLAAPAAHALQLIDAKDGVAVEAIVSIKEPTRIRIEGAAITDVFGSIYSSQCSTDAAGLTAMPPGPPVTPAPNAVGLNQGVINPAGEVMLECDRDKGEVYIRPVGTSSKPINLFVASAQATYTLVLRRSDTPADTIVIRDRHMGDRHMGDRQIGDRTNRDRLSDSRADATTPSGALVHRPLGPSAHPIRSMKALLVAMATDKPGPDVQVEEVGSTLRLWAESDFSLVRRYEMRELFGEKYLLRNISPAVMVLAEQEFDRPDGAMDGQVLGVAIENHNLRPGESTFVYVIRRGGVR